MNDKITVTLLIFIIAVFIYTIPRFVNFIETQDDILKIKNTNHQTFYMSAKKEVKDYKNNFNVPIPEDIKIKIAERQNELKIIEQKKMEEQKQKEIQNQMEKEKQIKLAKEQEGKRQNINKNKANQVTTRSESIPRDNNGWVKFVATAYCGCSKCCGKSTGITASGTKATQGKTVAMPSFYKFGTKIEIQGMGTYIVEDRGGAIKGNRIDIFFSSHKQALNFGKRTVYLKIL